MPRPYRRFSGGGFGLFNAPLPGYGQLNPCAVLGNLLWRVVVALAALLVVGEPPVVIVALAADQVNADLPFLWQALRRWSPGR